MLYRKKPVVISAVPFEDTHDSLVAIGRMGLVPIVVSYANPSSPVLVIKTLEGDMSANVGDYIIKGVKGEFYPIKAEIFLETYERVGSVH